MRRTIVSAMLCAVAVGQVGVVRAVGPPPPVQPRVAPVQPHVVPPSPPAPRVVTPVQPQVLHPYAPSAPPPGTYRIHPGRTGPNGTYQNRYRTNPYRNQERADRPGYDYPNYHNHGRYYERPAWRSRDVHSYRRRYYSHYPSFQSYGLYYGLYPSLAAFPALAFLDSAILVGTYPYQDRTVYVYVIEEDGVTKEYRVDDFGNILSVTVVPE